MTKYLQIICLFTLYASILYSQTHISAGKVSGVWQKENSPYFIDGEIKVPRGDKLIIDPGVKIIFTGRYKIVVYGTIQVIGTERDLILFTAQDSSLGWHGMRFLNAKDTSHIRYCILEYGRAVSQLPLHEYQADDIPYDNPESKWWDQTGGALLIINSNLIVDNCLFRNNFAQFHGGAISCVNYSTLYVRNCILKNNIADNRGGAFWIKHYVKPEIISCQIERNRSRNGGGGIFIEHRCHSLIRNCKISDNYTLSMGGGIFVSEYGNAVIDSCIVEKNRAGRGGGGIGFYTSMYYYVKISKNNF